MHHCAVSRGWPLLLALVLVGCGSSGGAGTAEPGPGGSSQASDSPLTRQLAFDFDRLSDGDLDQGAAVASTTGPAATVQLGGDSPLPLKGVEGRDGGHAVQFPAPCPPSSKPVCPKGIVEVEADDALNPGTKDIRWGADVLMTADETSHGDNLVQKGFSTGAGSQWKLQVDGDTGHPSCVVVGDRETKIHSARAKVSVSDGAWHSLVCHRTSRTLTISVDGGQAVSRDLPAGLDIQPDGPVRLGGKSLNPDNDQYFGTLDNVFVEVGK